MLPMDDHTDIFDVKSHAESARADDPIYLRPAFPGKPLEELLPLPGAAELRMVEVRFQSLFTEMLLQRLSNLTGWHKNHYLTVARH